MEACKREESGLIDIDIFTEERETEKVPASQGLF